MWGRVDTSPFLSGVLTASHTRVFRIRAAALAEVTHNAAVAACEGRFGWRTSLALFAKPEPEPDIRTVNTGRHDAQRPLPFAEKSMLYIPLLVLNGIYHYWRYIFPGDLSK